MSDIRTEVSPPSAAAQIKAPIVAPPKRKILPLSEHQIGQKQHKSQTYIAQPTPGTTLEDVMDPNYWVNIARMIRPFDDIEVRMPDNSWRALLQVVVRSDSWVKTLLVYYRDFSQEITRMPPAYPTIVPDTETAEGFKLSYNEIDLHGVVGPNGLQIVKGIETRKAAQKRMTELVAKFRAGEPLV